MAQTPSRKGKFFTINCHERLKHSPTRISVGRARISAFQASGSVGGEILTGGGEAEVWVLRASANSGKDESGCHSLLPSSWTRLRALSRPSKIQRRISSALTGP